MAGEKMKTNEQLEAPLLPLPVEVDKAVFLVCLWGLLNAGVVAFISAGVHILISVYELLLRPLLFQSPSVEVTEDAEVATGNGDLLLVYIWIWCIVPQAAGGTVALLLDGNRRRTRWALAYAVLAATVGGHCMYASLAGILVTSGSGIGYFFTITTSGAVLVFAMGDLLSFLALLVGDKVYLLGFFLALFVGGDEKWGRDIKMPLLG